MTEDEMVEWHHQLNGHGFKQTPGDSGGQGNLACCSPWGLEESHMTQGLNNNKTVLGIECPQGQPSSSEGGESLADTQLPSGPSCVLPGSSKGSKGVGVHLLTASLAHDPCFSGSLPVIFPSCFLEPFPQINHLHEKSDLDLLLTEHRLRLWLYFCFTFTQGCSSLLPYIEFSIWGLFFLGKI